MLLHSTVQYAIYKTLTGHEALSPGTKLIPSLLSWSQQNDLKTTFLINVPHQIKRTLRLLTNKKYKKGFLYHFPKNGFYLCTKPIQNNDHRLHELFLERHSRAVDVTLFTTLVSQERGSHKTPTFTFPASSYGKICIVLGLSSNICRTMMYRLTCKGISCF